MPLSVEAAVRGDPERDFIIDVLRRKKAQLETLGPATDHPELARWQVQALGRMIERLQRPVLKINPFW